MSKTKQQLTGYILGVFFFFAATSPVTVYAQDYKDSTFISGFKIYNMDNIPEISEITFQLASELELDYVHVPLITSKYLDEEGNPDWSQAMNFYHIFELSNEYGISVLPAFYKHDGEWDTYVQKYADFIIDFLDEFNDENIKYIELQNEPMASNHFRGTPIDLANSTIAVYEEVKNKYPEIIVGSPGFLISAVNDEDNDSINEYMDECLSANPKFDIFMLHHYPKSGAYLQGTSSSDYKYNFLSEYNIFNTCRTLLDDYGYENIPILVTEGHFDMPFLEEDGTLGWNYLDDEDVEILLAERFVLALSNKDNNLIGSMISAVESECNGALFNYNEVQQNYIITNKFDFYKKILNYTREYPIYSKHIAGTVNLQNYWIEEYKNKDEKKTWLAFCPLLMDIGVQIFPDHFLPVVTNIMINYPQDVELDVGNIKKVKISTLSDTWTVEAVNGKVSFSLGKNPVFIEEHNATSVNDINFNNDNIKIYPNPANGIFTIQGDSIQSVEILNINGQTVYS